MPRFWTILLLLAVAAPAYADEPPATTLAELAARLKAGQRVIVESDQGSSLRGRVADVSGELLVLEQAGRRVALAMREITTMRRPPDRLWNGALVGLLVGAGAGAAGALAADCDDDAFNLCPGLQGVTVLVASLAGMGGGLAVDALHHRDPVVYARPLASTAGIPVLRARATGIRVTLAF